MELPNRTSETMVEAIALSSPSGSMSKRSRKLANERLRISLFGESGLPKPTVQQPTLSQSLLRQARELRSLAARGMKPRAYIKRAQQLEAQAKE